MSVRATLAGVRSFIWARPQTGEEVGGTSARYSYAVWLRHIVNAFQRGLQVPPETVVELGPGGSLGVGIAALLCGSSTYHALDTVPYVSAQDTQLLDELVELFRARADIPDESEFPDLEPHLDSHQFPDRVFPEQFLTKCLLPQRIGTLRRALQDIGKACACGHEQICVRYSAPWNTAEAVPARSVDLIMSQAALEHVEDLRGTYAAMGRWLKRDGFATHQIDFRCHHTAKKWNGHWAFSDLHWRIIKGKRPYLINRQSVSTHIAYAVTAGLEPLASTLVFDDQGIRRHQLARRFRDLTEEDLKTSGAFLVFRKRCETSLALNWP